MPEFGVSAQATILAPNMTQTTKFKKPLDYDPSLAQKTLAAVHSQSGLAPGTPPPGKKRQNLLVELGLADEEGIDLEDEDDYDDTDEVDTDVDEKPLLSNTKVHATNGTNGSLATYGYKDVYSREYEKRRKALIDMKGVEKYLAELQARSTECLQLLRADRNIQYPGSVEVIAELQHELDALNQDNKQLRLHVTKLQDTSSVEASNSSVGVSDVELKRVQDRIKELQARVTDLESLTAQKDATIKQLQLQLSSAQALAANAAVATSPTGATQQLQQLLKQREELVQQVQVLQQQQAHQASVENTAVQTLELGQRVTQQAAVIKQLEVQKQDAEKQAADLKRQLARVSSQASQGLHSKSAQIQALVEELHALRGEVLAELVAMQQEMFSDKALMQMTRIVRDKEIMFMRKVKSESRGQLDEYKKRVEESEEQMTFVRQQAEEQVRIKELETTGIVNHFKEKWRQEFEKRKRLHNQVLELKGNIRVLCRVRPLLDKEKSSGEDMPVKVLNEENVRVNSEKSDKEFEFDRVFAPVEGQEKIFEEVVALVTSVLDGFNVCIMAYGQTGSGKTFTMEGPLDNPGVNWRALTELFRLAQDRSEEITYNFSASILEIYNEQIFDLLAGSAKEQDDKLDVKQSAEGMYVPGLKIEDVHNLDAVADVISRGKQNRSTFATNMNEHSSRSHLVLSVYVVARNKVTGVTLRGKLHLIDLAGSERLSRTGAQGDRLKEAQNINKSLSALGDVIQALQLRTSHVPYRNSKLTRLLEDSLGGNSKCVMVVNVSPASENVSETKCSLEFASRARKVELGRAKQNVDGPITPPKPSDAKVSALKSTASEAGSRSVSRKSSASSR